MDPSEKRAAARIAELRRQLEHHNRLYYVEAAPEIDDTEYDRLFRGGVEPGKLVIGLVNGLASEDLWRVAITLNVVLLAVMFVADHPRMLSHAERHRVGFTEAVGAAAEVPGLAARTASAVGRELGDLTLLVNGIYWDERYPRLLNQADCRALWTAGRTPRLRVVADISCDVDGALAATVFHNNKVPIPALKQMLSAAGIGVRL